MHLCIYIESTVEARFICYGCIGRFIGTESDNAGCENVLLSSGSVDFDLFIRVDVDADSQQAYN